MTQRGVWLGWGKRSVSHDYDMNLIREQKGRIIIISIITVIVITIVISILSTRRPSCCHEDQWTRGCGEQAGVGAEQLVLKRALHWAQ